MTKMITPMKIAKAAGIDPKGFRAALRKSNLTWHKYHGSWSVPEGSSEHKDMQRVLKTLQPDDARRTKSKKAKNARKVAKKPPSDIIGPSNVLALKEAGFVIVTISELSQFRENIKSVLDSMSVERPRKRKA